MHLFQFVRNLLPACLFCTTVLAVPSIWTVNPDPEAGADFDDLQTAINDASAGDILYVAGLYDDASISLDKTLILYGTGYWLAENSSTPDTTPQQSIINDLNIQPGAEGSLISGFTLESTRIEIEGLITFKGNLFMHDIYTENAEHILFSQNYFSSNSYLNNRGAISVKFENNFIFSSEVILHEQQNIFCNNLISSRLLCNDNSLCYFAYNIFLESEFHAPPVARKRSYYNVLDHESADQFNASDYPFSDTDILDVDALAIFDSLPYHENWGWYIDSDFILPDDSAAKDIDDEGTDAGPFGGNQPYRLSGLPNIPRIESLEAPHFATSSGGLTINVKINVEPSISD